MKLTAYRLRIYVGPVHVTHYAQNARSAGFTDVYEGTEHVYVTTLAPELKTETDRLLLRLRTAESIYGEPGHVTAWRDTELLHAN
jgi:hypothetical protein